MYRVDHSRNRLCSGTNGRRESKNNIQGDEVALSKTNSRLLADNIRYNIRSRNVSRLVRSVCSSCLPVINSLTSNDPRISVPLHKFVDVHNTINSNSTGNDYHSLYGNSFLWKEANGKEIDDFWM